MTLQQINNLSVRNDFYMISNHINEITIGVIIINEKLSKFTNRKKNETQYPIKSTMLQTFLPISNSLRASNNL